MSKLPESLLTVIADYGESWGPVALPGLGPFIYTGHEKHVEEAAQTLAQAAALSGMEARVVRFTKREDVAVFLPPVDTQANGR